VPADPTPVPHGRAAGVALLLSCLLLLAFAVALLVEDRAAVVTLLIVFAIVSVPALLSAVLGLRAALGLLRDGTPERATPGYAALLAVGHLGVVALSLRPGLDRRLDVGDLAGGAAGAVGALAALVALAVVLPGRTFAVRLVAALGAGVLALALLGLRAAAQLD
jgi:hypothetical protein